MRKTVQGDVNDNCSGSGVISALCICKKRMYLWWRSCTLYLHACQMRVTVGDSGLCCSCSGRLPVFQTNVHACLQSFHMPVHHVVLMSMQTSTVHLGQGACSCTSYLKLYPHFVKNVLTYMYLKW